AEPDVVGEFNVCTGRPTTILQVARSLADRLGVHIEPETVGRYRAGDIRHCVGDPTRARVVLGFEATTSFEDGLEELIAWSAAEEAIDRVEANCAGLERQGLVK